MEDFNTLETYESQYMKMTIEYMLVGGAITILKNMKVNGKDYPIDYGK